MFWTPKSTCKGTVASPRPQRQIPEKRPAVTASSGCSMGISKAASDCESFGSDCHCLGTEVPGYFSEIQSHYCFSHWQIICVLFLYPPLTCPSTGRTRTLVHTPCVCRNCTFLSHSQDHCGPWDSLVPPLTNTGLLRCLSFPEFHSFITVSSNYPIGVCHLPVRNLTSYSFS